MRHFLIALIALPCVAAVNFAELDEMIASNDELALSTITVRKPRSEVECRFKVTAKDGPYLLVVDDAYGETKEEEVVVRDGQLLDSAEQPYALEIHEQLPGRAIDVILCSPEERKAVVTHVVPHPIRMRAECGYLISLEPTARDATGFKLRVANLEPGQGVKIKVESCGKAQLFKSRADENGVAIHPFSALLRKNETGGDLKVTVIGREGKATIESPWGAAL